MPDSRIKHYLAADVYANRPSPPDTVDGQLPFYLATDTTGLTVWDGTAWRPINSAAYVAYPQVNILFPTDFKVKTGCGGSIVINANSAMRFFQFGDQATPGNGDVIEASVWLEVGTYDVVVCGLTSTDRGKIDWSLDGLSPFMSAQDWYSGSAAYNVIKTGTLTVSVPGRHLLDATVNGKNASASNYYFSIAYITLINQTLTVS